MEMAWQMGPAKLLEEMAWLTTLPARKIPWLVTQQGAEGDRMRRIITVTRLLTDRKTLAENVLNVIGYKDGPTKLETRALVVPRGGSAQGFRSRDKQAKSTSDAWFGGAP